MNMLSPQQEMNASFEPLHLVNTYGAFGSITRPRYEVIIEGTHDASLTRRHNGENINLSANPATCTARHRRSLLTICGSTG